MLWNTAVLLFSLPLFSLHRVTREYGQLKTLGVGSAIISAKAATHLKRWGIALLVCSVLMALMGLQMMVVGGLLGGGEGAEVTPDGADPKSAEARVTYVLLGLLNGFVVPLCSLCWWLSLKTASAVVRAEVLACRKLIDSASATTLDQWDAAVVPQVLQLINVTLPALSTGWANGLLWLWAATWVVGLSIFSWFFETGKPQAVFFSFICFCFPLGLAADVAGTSSDCDSIATSLNDKRSESKLDVATDAKLQILERAIMLQNQGAGIGFVVAGKVLDRTTLKTIFVAMSGFLSTVVPLILALRPKEFVIGTEACALSETQTASVQAAFVGFNATCSYDNVTLGSVLRFKTDDA
jgi:hypothetical protein